MSNPPSSRDRMLAALSCQTPDHPPCSFMIFGALHQRADTYLDFVERELDLGLDAFVMLPQRPPIVRNDHYNLHGLPVTYHPDVSVDEQVVQSSDGSEPVMVKTYHTPAGDLTAHVRQTAKIGAGGTMFPFWMTSSFPGRVNLLSKVWRTWPHSSIFLKRQNRKRLTRFRKTV